LRDKPCYEEHGREIFDMVLEMAFKLGRELLLPHFQEMDKTRPSSSTAR